MKRCARTTAIVLEVEDIRKQGTNDLRYAENNVPGRDLWTLVDTGTVTDIVRVDLVTTLSLNRSFTSL